MKRRVGALIYPVFEILDLFGPLEMFALLEDDFSITLVAEKEHEIDGIGGCRVVAGALFSDQEKYDLLLIPGGRGTRAEIENSAIGDWLQRQSKTADLVTSVCTGSALLARAGLLDGRKATSNKEAFEWVASQGPKVDWQRRARWCADGKFFTSSGVSAGMDMTLAAIQHLLGRDKALEAAHWAEYIWNEDPSNDPFTKESR